MKLISLSEEMGREPDEHLAPLLNAIREQLTGAGLEPMIMVRDNGEAANIFVKGDRRIGGITIRTGMDGNREGDTWRYYRAEDGTGQTVKFSKNPVDIMSYAVSRLAGRRGQV